MKIIGITGLAGSGKDTLGNAFVKLGYARVSFADKLKDIVADAYNWDREMLEGDLSCSRAWRERQDLTWGITPRSALQQVGVKFREIDPDFWVKSMFERLDPNRKYVVTDMRFPNEFEAISHVGMTIRVWGPDMVLEGAEGNVIQPPEWWRDAAKYNTYMEIDRTPGSRLMTPVLPESLRDIHVSEYGAAHLITHEVYKNYAGDDFKHRAARAAEYFHEMIDD